MKNLFVFCMLLTGCIGQLTDEEYVDSEQNDEVEVVSLDVEDSSLPKELGCPVDYKEVVINNYHVWVVIPTICGIDPIDQGRPVEEEFLNLPEEILEEVEEY